MPEILQQKTLSQSPILSTGWAFSVVCDSLQTRRWVGLHPLYTGQHAQLPDCLKTHQTHVHSRRSIQLSDYLETHIPTSNSEHRIYLLPDHRDTYQTHLQQ